MSEINLESGGGSITGSGSPNERNIHWDSRPVPDPTNLTRLALSREITTLRELLTARLDAMDKATALFEVNLTRVPTEVDKQIGHLNSLLTEKIEGSQRQSAERLSRIEGMFVERDLRATNVQAENKEQVSSALVAAKELVAEHNKSIEAAMAKSEASFIRQIEALGVLIATSSSAQSDKVDDLKQRITTIEGVDRGKADGVSMVWVALLGVITIAVGFIGIGSFVFAGGHGQAPVSQAPQILYVPAPVGSAK